MEPNEPPLDPPLHTGFTVFYLVIFVLCVPIGSCVYPLEVSDITTICTL